MQEVSGREYTFETAEGMEVDGEMYDIVNSFCVTRVWRERQTYAAATTSVSCTRRKSTELASFLILKHLRKLKSQVIYMACFRSCSLQGA